MTFLLAAAALLVLAFGIAAVLIGVVGLLPQRALLVFLGGLAAVCSGPGPSF